MSMRVQLLTRNDSTTITYTSANTYDFPAMKDKAYSASTILKLICKISLCDVI